MLATLTDERFDNKDWIYEKKLDGVRVLTFVKEKKISLYSRNKILQNKYYPELIKPLQGLAKNFILDGEVVCFDKNITSFSKLQGRMHEELLKGARSSIKIYYYVFDLLYLNGVDLRDQTLKNRKSLLRRAFKFQDPIRVLSYKKEKGIKYYKEACQKNWEGIIAKDFQSTYSSERTDSWLKFKCAHEQEMVVGGFTKGQNSRLGFGALLMGYYKNKNFIYAGKLGTGFDDAELQFLKAKMDKLKISNNPFSNYDGAYHDVTWIKPKLVVQVGFAEWTPTGKLRHPRYLGLREDKVPQDVAREKTLKL